MSYFKPGQIKIAFKAFYKQKKVINIFTINVNKVVVSNKSERQQ